MKSASAIDRRFLLVIPYFTYYVVRSVALLLWITVLNKRSSKLDPLLFAGMALVKNNSWQFPKCKMAAGVVYYYCSRFPLGPFSGVSSKAPNCFFVVLVFVNGHVGVTMK